MRKAGFWVTGYPWFMAASDGYAKLKIFAPGFGTGLINGLLGAEVRCEWGLWVVGSHDWTGIKRQNLSARLANIGTLRAHGEPGVGVTAPSAPRSLGQASFRGANLNINANTDGTGTTDRRGLWCYHKGMNGQEIIAELRENEPALRARGVSHAALFGSRARGDNRPDSDIDIMVEFDPAARVTVFNYAGLKEYIAGLFDGPVDVVSRDGLKPYVRPAATTDAIYAF